MPTITPRRPRETPSYLDPQSLMGIENLQLRAKIVVQGLFNGLHKSPYHGFSVEFTEYRQYTPGDDPRYLDWKLYARSDRSHIKRFEDETNLRGHLLLDLSRSMEFGSRGYSKADYARTLAATLAFLLARQRDAVGLVTFDRDVRDYLPARYRPGHLRRLTLLLSGATGGDATRLGPPLEKVARLVRKRGLIWLISDLLAPADELESRLGHLTAMGHEVCVLRVLDPAERELDFPSPSLFEDLESGRTLYVDPDAAREEYLRRLSEHDEQVASICRELGADYFTFTTDTPPESALAELLRGRQRRIVRRRRPS